MKRITTLALAAITAFSIAATAFTATASAGDRERRVAAGVIIGAIGGAIIASEINRSKGYRKQRAHRRNNDYRRYNGHRRYDDQRRDYRPRQIRSYESPRYERRVNRQPRVSQYQRHVNRCYAAYRSYDHRSDTFIGYDGIERRCTK